MELVTHFRTPACPPLLLGNFTGTARLSLVISVVPQGLSGDDEAGVLQLLEDVVSQPIFTQVHRSRS